MIAKTILPAEDSGSSSVDGGTRANIPAIRRKPAVLRLRGLDICVYESEQQCDRQREKNAAVNQPLLEMRVRKEQIVCDVCILDSLLKRNKTSCRQFLNWHGKRSTERMRQLAF